MNVEDLERQAPTALRELVPPRPPSHDLLDEVAVRVVRRRRAKWSMASAAIAVVVVASFSAAATRGSTSPPAAVAVAAPSCPTVAPDGLPKPQRQGAATELVPGSPVIATACRYYGMNLPQHDGSLAGSVVIRGTVVVTWARALNAGRSIGKGVYNCPMDQANKYLVIYAYATGADISVEVDTTGCMWATNGKATLEASPGILHLLESALGKDTYVRS
jgi:hypothetical protein